MSEEQSTGEQVEDIDATPELEDDAEWTLVERSQYFVASSLAAVLYPFRALATAIHAFVGNWLASRPPGWLSRGLPAAVALVAAGYLALAPPPHSSSLVAKYREAAAEAAEAGDTAAAELWLEKTLQVNPMDPEHRYNLAMAAILEDQEDRGREIITSLAPEDGLGYPPAHFWIAQDLMEQDQSPAVLQRIEHHLLQSLEDDEDEVEAHAMLGDLYLRHNRPNVAIPHLRQAASARPELYFSLAQALRAAGLVDESLESAAKARDYYRQQMKENPSVADHRRGWAFSEQMLGNHAQAVAILEGGLDSDDAHVFEKSLVDVYINWHNAQVAAGKANLAWQLEILSRALKFGPKDPRLLTQLAKLAMRDWEQSDEALALLRELVARGVAPALVHLVIGTQSLKAGDFADANAHLQLANDQNPETPPIMNNLAWLLAHQDNPDLPRALELARTANKLSPRPEIHDTIGTILLLMGKDREAIVELETALRGLPDNAELHGKLADAYEKLGEQELARIHRRLADPEVAEP